MIFKNDEELQAKCEEWQKRLRLQDWIVYCGICRAKQIDDGAQGECERKIKKKKATIRILDPLDFDPHAVTKQDMEHILVHELLHLHFAPIYANTEDVSIDDALEIAVDCIAHSLVDLHRASQSQAKKELKVV